MTQLTITEDPIDGSLLKCVFKAMGGPCVLRIHTKHHERGLEALQAAHHEVLRLERKYSRYREDSVTSQINAAAGLAPISIDSETAGLLQYADTAYRMSGGLFDLTSGVLRKYWNFHSGKLPESGAIEETRGLVGWHRVDFSERDIRLPAKGMEIDFGGVVKEYAVDSAVRILRRSFIDRGLVDLAGDMGAFGRPGENGWVVGIKHPRSPQQAVTTVELANFSLASSGDYERSMVVGGKRYGHVLNPKTGWPTPRAPIAVSTMAPNCLVAGSSTTIAMLMPAPKSKKWLSEFGLPWLLVDPDLRVSGTLSKP